MNCLNSFIYFFFWFTLFIQICGASDSSSSLFRKDKVWSEVTLKYAPSYHYKPLSYVSENNEHLGYASEVMKQISALTGVSFVMSSSENLTFAEDRQRLAEGELDFLGCAFYSEARKKSMLLTDSYLSLDSSLFTLKHQKRLYNSLQKLRGHTLALPAGHTAVEQLERLYPDIKLLKVGTTKQASDAVLSGEAQALLGEVATATDILGIDPKQGFVMVGETPFQLKIAFALQDDLAEMVPIFNQVISQVSVTLNHNDSVNYFSHQVDRGRRLEALLIGSILLSVIFVAIIVSFANVRKERRRAVELNNEKTKIMVALSHDLRNPLTGVIGMLRASQEAGSLEECQAHVRDALLCSDKLLDLLTHTLDYSQIEKGQLKVKYAPVDLKSLLCGLHKQIYIPEEKGVKFELSLKNPDKIPPRILTDEVRFSQVLVNVIGNAVKFTTNGFVRVNVEWLEEEKPLELFNSEEVSALLEEGQGVCIDIIDEGIGISPEHLECIFSPYEQGDAKRRLTYGGLGLGLSICLQLCELLNGKIKVTSVLGQGTHFSLLFALQTAALPDNQVPAQSTRLGVSALEDSSFLIADDDAINLRLAQEVCKSAGVRKIDTASNGKIALEKLSSQTYHYTLLDVEMPVLDGVQTLQSIRQQGLLDVSDKPIKVYAVTAHSHRDQEFLNLGFDGVLHKPLTIDDVKSLVS